MARVLIAIEVDDNARAGIEQVVARDGGSTALSMSQYLGIMFNVLGGVNSHSVRNTRLIRVVDTPDMISLED